MQHFSIGAASRLTGVPAHTLRKWESRHGIAIPIRTKTGRRAYTQANVDQLRLVKMLVERRHALAQLAALTITELQELAILHDQAPTRQVDTASVAIIGPTIHRLLLSNPQVLSRSPQLIDDVPPENCDTLIIESDTLPQDLENKLTQWAGAGRTIIAVYRFTSRSALKRLEDAGVHCTQAPVSDQTLTRLLNFVPTPQAPAPSGARFSTEELARIAALSPNIACECPNHIAKLLMDISSFERYSEQCVKTDPVERALHAQLGDISTKARRLFEDALLAVATTDGLHLNTNSTQD